MIRKIFKKISRGEEILGTKKKGSLGTTVPCTMVHGTLYYGTPPVPRYRVTPNYARIVKPFYEVIYDMEFFREFLSKSHRIFFLDQFFIASSVKKSALMIFQY